MAAATRLITAQTCCRSSEKPQNEDSSWSTAHSALGALSLHHMPLARCENMHEYVSGLYTNCVYVSVLDMAFMNTVVQFHCLLSQALSDAGLVAGCDMTPESALSKLSYVLAKKDLTTQEKKKVA